MIPPAPGAPAMSARQAEIHALRVAQEAAAHVPAYARFLRLAGYDASRLRSFAEFCALPTMDKPSYLTRYSLEQRCRRGDLARAHIVTLSSGSTGQPVLWPRFPEQDAVLQDGFMAGASRSARPPGPASGRGSGARAWRGPTSRSSA